MIDVMEEKDLYLASFSAFEKTAAGPHWLTALRSAAIERFAELGFPGPRDEDWKFTNLAPLAAVPFALAEPERLSAAEMDRLAFTMDGFRAVFVNGRFQAALSRLDGLPVGATITNLADALKTHAGLIETHLAQYARLDDHPFTALNTAFVRDGAFVHLARNTILQQPIHLVFLSTGGPVPTVTYPRTLVLCDSHAQAALVQSYGGQADTVYFTNAVTEVVLAEGARLDHYKVQREGNRAFHFETLQVQMNRASNFRSHAITLGGGLARNESNAVLHGQGGECTLNGLYFATGKQHIDNRTFIDHAQPHCASHEVYKGIIDGKAHAVFNGKIYVRQDAQKTDAKQTNQTLLLSDDAVINTKPQLEIYADDVKCTHGATVGQLSEEALFYLRSRGLGLEQARQLLIYAFANDLVGRIQIDSLRQQLEEQLLSRQELPVAADLEEAS